MKFSGEGHAELIGLIKSTDRNFKAGYGHLILPNWKGSLVNPAALVTPTALSMKSSFQRQTEVESGRRGKERERIHRITNELRDSIKHLLDALLRGGRAKQGVRKK